jgi:hypothetical protein
MPEGMARVSGSAPRLPIRMTLLIPRAMRADLHRKKNERRLYGQASRSGSLITA